MVKYDCLFQNKKKPCVRVNPGKGNAAGKKQCKRGLKGCVLDQSPKVSWKCAWKRGQSHRCVRVGRKARVSKYSDQYCEPARYGCRQKLAAPQRRKKSSRRR